jgi:UDP-N-acetylmuramate: L-alanyl-gamma-D-glutamyl-meso-diaminopimelate ligase
MHPNFNRIPDRVNSIHLIAVCGTGMGALACMLKDKGYQVSGSDNNIYPPMSTSLKEKEIALSNGFEETNLSHSPDLVVVGNAVTRDNPEAIKMQQMELCYCSMPQAVNRFVVGNKKSLVVTGTHGKTTTASILAWILESAGLQPSYMIGGIVNNFNSNYRLGNGDYFVIEGDEYDTAFFDKGPKFLHYRAHTLIITGIEFDHADIFNDLDHIKQVFAQLISSLPKDAALVGCADDGNVRELMRRLGKRPATYGTKEPAFWRLGPVAVHGLQTRFDVFKGHQMFGNFKTTLPGEHNRLNMLAVIAAAHGLGISSKDIQRGLETFKGVKRRQEIRGIKSGITVMDDFAHHPTAVRETIRALKTQCIDGRLIAVFEPRTNSSMRNIFQDVYPLSFEGADMVCIRKPPLLKKIPLKERFSSEKLVTDLQNRGQDARYFSKTDAIIAFLKKAAKPKDLILIMSNGGFDNIHERLLKIL